MCIRLNNAGKWPCDRLKKEANFGKKKIIFSDEGYFDLDRVVNKKNWQFLFENEQGEAVTVNGDRYRAMLNEVLFTKFKEEDIGNI